jgi:hypothetical protein
MSNPQLLVIFDYAACAIYDRDSEHFVWQAEKGIQRVITGRRIHIPAHPVKYTATLPDPKSALSVIEGLRDLIKGHLDPLVLEARTQNPQVNQVRIVHQGIEVSFSGETVTVDFNLGMSVSQSQHPYGVDLEYWQTKKCSDFTCLKRNPETRGRWFAEQIYFNLFHYNLFDVTFDSPSQVP